MPALSSSSAGQRLRRRGLDKEAMQRGKIMILAGEPSGDALAADLVVEIRRAIGKGELIPSFFGIGGPKLKDAGVELLENMTDLTVFGMLDVARRFFHFKRIFRRVLEEAKQRQPKWIILVDYGGFNLRFAKAIRSWSDKKARGFANWRPRMVYYVPPQVWASREGRAASLASAVDLVVSIFPFEKDWYRKCFPELPVKYVGDPMAARFRNFPSPADASASSPPQIALLPGSRPQEIRRHLPLMLEAFEELCRRQKCQATVVTPNPKLTQQSMLPPNVKRQVGNAAEVLRRSTVAIAASGAVTRECAYLGVPAVVVYKLPWLDYQIAKRAVKIRHIAMPNILAGETIFPELIQNAATPKAIAQEALRLLDSEERIRIAAALKRLTSSLGPPGASRRAAQEIIAAFGKR